MSDSDVVIAVLTYRRPDDLASALHGLLEHIAGSNTEASILVVDNDEEPTADDIVAAAEGVLYVHEPRPGIAAARNRALDESTTQRLLVFIDDDERPQPGWLDSLVGSWQHSRPAAVAGPVISRFTTPLDSWIEAGGFFQRLRHSTGTEVPVAATNNLLLDLEVVRSLGLRFDERFGISGGSDTFFTGTLARAGGRIVWCDEAVVTDVVPTERATRGWVLQRAMRMGNSGSRSAVLLEQPGIRRVRVRMRLAGQAFARIAVGGSRLAFGRLTSSTLHHARGTRTLARGRGMLSGALGRVVVEYDRSDSMAFPEL